MAHIDVSRLSYELPTGELLFEDVSFRVGDGQVAALIGINGVGKSTLLRILAGQIAHRDGAVTTGGTLRYLSQAVGFDDQSRTVREMLLNLTDKDLAQVGHRIGDAQAALEGGDDSAGIELGAALADWGSMGGYDLEAQWDAACRRVLGLGMDQVETRNLSELSGGERKRLLLEVLLHSAADILLLDEPDNYLDIPGKRWLEDELRTTQKTVLIVSHDRSVLSTSVSRIITLEPDGAWVHGESYASYSDARESRQQLMGDEVKRWHEEERRLYRHYKTMKQRAAQNDKNAPKADAAESRWRRWERSGPPPPPARAQSLKVRLVGAASAQRVLRLEDVVIPGLVSSFNAEVLFGERLGLIGGNGAGKTHLARLLAGQVIEHHGRVVFGNRTSVGLFTQINVRPDFVGRKVVEIVLERVGTFEQAMGALSRYGLQSTARRDFDQLSGGQRARLEILCLELEQRNVLILDEPTDNLDIESAEALEHALDSFEGTVVAVTHDRTFLSRFDRFLLVAPDTQVYEITDADEALAVLESRRRSADLTGLKLLSA